MVSAFFNSFKPIITVVTMWFLFIQTDFRSLTSMKAFDWPVLMKLDIEGIVREPWQDFYTKNISKNWQNSCYGHFSWPSSLKNWHNSCFVPDGRALSVLEYKTLVFRFPFHIPPEVHWLQDTKMADANLNRNPMINSGLLWSSWPLKWVVNNI